MRKSIYVIPEDEELFEWASNVGDNLSAVISQSLWYCRDRQIRYTNHRNIREEQMGNQLSDSLREHEYRIELLKQLTRIAGALEESAKNHAAALDVTRRTLAVSIINSKLLAQSASRSYLTDTEYEKVMEVLNQV